LENLKMPPDGTVSEIRLKSEKERYNRITSDEEIMVPARELLSGSEYDSNRRRLLASALRVSEKIIPTLTYLVKIAKTITAFKRDVEVYIVDDPLQNASCMDFGSGPVFLLFSSGIIEKMRSRELLFVIGHELGHMLYHHHDIPAYGLMNLKDRMTPEQTISLMSWNRRAEISVDRVGLLCCQNITDAGIALIKLSCGLTERSIKFDINEYTEQMQEIQKLSESVLDSQDWYSTHPFNPLRVLALRYFWESDAMTGLLGHSAEHKLSAETLDSRIAEMMNSMEPMTSRAEEAIEAECLLWGGYLVAASDGRLDVGELRNIEGNVPENMVAAAREQINHTSNFTQLFQEKFNSAAKKAKKLPLAERNIIIQKLVAVARADTVVDNAEKVVLRKICEQLGVNPTFADQMLLMME